MTTPTSQEMLDAYIAAEKQVLAGQEVRLEGRLLRLPDLAVIQAGRKRWQQTVNDEARATAGDKTRARVAYSNFSGRNYGDGGCR